MRIALSKAGQFHLGDMIEMPALQGNDAPIPFDIFLRLPRAMARAVADKDGVYVVKDTVIFRYPGSEGYNVFLAGALEAARAQKKAGPEWTMQTFREHFRLALGMMLKRQLRPPEKVERLFRPATSYTGDKLPDLIFDYFILEDDPAGKDPTSVAVYVHAREGHLLAMAFQFPRAAKNDMAVQQGIDVSLRSLDIGETATGKRTAYGSFRRLD